jgi:hypothetical protein
MSDFKAILSLVDWRDVAVRAGKTFLQAAVAYLLAALGNADIFGGDATKTFWVGLLMSTLAAGASAAWNGVIKPALVAWKDKLSDS